MSNFHRHLVISVATSGKIYSQQSKEYVSRRVREVAPLSSNDDSDIASPLPRHFTDDTRHLELEIERRAIKKSRERMELELCMVEEKYTSGEEEELVWMETEEQERREAEHRTEIVFKRWKEEADRELQQQE